MLTYSMFFSILCLINHKQEIFMNLYSDEKTLQYVKLLADTDEVIYNLWEDILALKEQNQELQDQLEIRVRMLKLSDLENLALEKRLLNEK